MIEHIIFLGLNDKNTHAQEISTVDAYKIAMRLVIESGYTGATITEATGFYTHDDGSVVIEKSLRVELIDANESRTHALIDAMKKTFNQESVLLQKINTATDFI